MKFVLIVSYLVHYLGQKNDKIVKILSQRTDSLYSQYINDGNTENPGKNIRPSSAKTPQLHFCTFCVRQFVWYDSDVPCIVVLLRGIESIDKF